MKDGKKVIGIICECNPFHKGHKLLINEAKKRGDILIAVMSGNFVQRGEPAVYDKYSRTKKLIKNGIDMVIELPVEYVLSSASYFAMAGITILHKLRYVDEVIFGSIINDIDKLKYIASIDTTKTKNLIKSGLSYPKALEKVYGTKLSPNDILAVEYIKAINELKSKIKPICIKRDSSLPTASELRKNIKAKVTCDNFSDILTYKIYDAVNNDIDLSKISSVNADLANAIKNTYTQNLSFTKRAKLLNTKNRTLANIKRAFFNIIFDIKEKNIRYIRILGIKKESMHLLKDTKFPYLLSFAPSSYKSCKKNFSKFDENDTSIRCNIFATDLYNIISKTKKMEVTTPTLII